MDTNSVDTYPVDKLQETIEFLWITDKKLWINRDSSN